jgi:hypothetical protein
MKTATVSVASLVVDPMDAELPTPFSAVARSVVVRAAGPSSFGIRPRSYAG